MDSITALEVIVAVLAVFAASTVFSSLGFGIGLVGLPLLLLAFDTQTSIVLINTTALPLVLLIFWNSREHADLRRVLPIAVMGALGALLGAFVLTTANDTALKIAIIILILIFTAMSAFNIQITVPKPGLMGPFVGFLVGLMITSVGIGGPLLILFMLALNWGRHTVRASMAFFFVFMILSAIAGYTFGDLYTLDRLVLLGSALVPALIGFYVGNTIAHRMNERLFRYFVVAVISVGSLVVLAREVVQLMSDSPA